MAFPFADSNDAPDARQDTATAAQPDFGQYILPESTLYEPLPSPTLVPSIDLPTLDQIDATGQSPVNQYSPENYIYHEEFKADPEYLPTESDYREFTWAGGFFQSNFSREQIRNIADNSKAPDGARRLADYLSRNFDTVASTTSSGDEATVNLNDVKLIVQLVEVQSDVLRIEAGKDLLVDKFDTIDTDGDNALSNSELKKALHNTNDETMTFALEGLLNHREVLFDGWSHLISKDALSNFEAKTAFDSIARDRHSKLEMPNHTFMAEWMGATLGVGIAYYAPRRAAPFIILATGTLGRSIGSALSGDAVEMHYEQQASPAIKKLLEDQ